MLSGRVVRTAPKWSACAKACSTRSGTPGDGVLNTTLQSHAHVCASRSLMANRDMSEANLPRLMDESIQERNAALSESQDVLFNPRDRKPSKLLVRALA